MKAADFHKFQQSGENVCIEFKRGGNGAQKDTFETICAFLNRFGGDVFLGVADNANRATAHGIITPENVRPVSKNPIIAAFFKEIGRADELGSGTRNLYHYTRLYSGTDPIIDEEDAFSVTVPLNDDYSPEVGKGSRGNDITQISIGDDTVNGTANDTVNGTVSGPLSGLKSGPLNGPLSGPLNGPLKDVVMNLIAEIPSVNRKDLVRRTGVAERTMTRSLSELERSGKIERRGSKKTGGYYLAEDSSGKWKAICGTV